MPVVDVDHVGPEVERPQHLEGGPAEIDEARIVVPEAVHAVAAEELLVVDEVDRHLARDPSFEDIRVDRLVRERHPQVGDDSPQSVLLHVDAAVARHDNPHVVAHRLERLGQRTRNVGEAAHLGEGRDFRRNEQDLEGLVLAPAKNITGYAHRDRSGGRELFSRLAFFVRDRHHLDRLAGIVPERFKGHGKGERLAA